MQWTDAINQRTIFKNAIETLDFKMHKIKNTICSINLVCSSLLMMYRKAVPYLTRLALKPQTTAKVAKDD